MIADECRAHGLGAVSLRYFNVAGASGRAGRGPRARDPPDPARPAGRGRAGATTCSSSAPTTRRDDGTAVRDYIHVEDLARRAPARARRSRARAATRSTTSATGTGFSVRQVIEAARTVTGREIEVREEAAPRRRPAAARRRHEQGRATGSAGSRERTLETMIADAWAWHQAHPDGYS